MYRKPSLLCFDSSSPLHHPFKQQQKLHISCCVFSFFASSSNQSSFSSLSRRSKSTTSCHRPTSSASHPRVFNHHSPTVSRSFHTTPVIMGAFRDGPYAPQNHQAVKEMIMSLEAHCKGGARHGKAKGGFSCKKSTFSVANNRTVDSWKMQDWDYKKPNLPTYARGLFTMKNSNGKEEIAVRGYDKFFNHGEVRNTEWRNVEKQTRGPYELSVKENGCIIFMSGLDDGTLLVCSKHSTGVRQDIAVSHAGAGEEWVEKHLTACGKTKQDLARKLRDMNVTAVAELCDDEFEEHVLAYTPKAAGLYLHGLNLNLPEFATYPAHLVNKFADEWGFQQTMFLTKDDVQEMKAFLDKCAEIGSYDGRETEGFVIRCRARENEKSSYRDWFFKYKFEEPYLMYRQWRECTKAVIAGKAPRFKKHQKITEEYLVFARRKLTENPQLGKLYNANHGIIKLRDDFLAERGLKGTDIIREELDSGLEVNARNVKRNIVLVPIATIGCGKTTVAIALAKLFGWGHLQNDNVEGRKGRPAKFASMICSSLVGHPVSVADRNNHQKREREQLMADVSKGNPDARYIALHYVHDEGNLENIRQVMYGRVFDRGDNHQTIQAASKGKAEILEIMNGFLKRFEPANPNRHPDAGFDMIIDLDPVLSSRENLETVISRLHSSYPALFEGRGMPSSDDMDDAIEFALSKYNPDFKQDLSRNTGSSSGRQLDKKQQKLQRQQQRQAKQDRGENFDPSAFVSGPADGSAGVGASNRNGKGVSRTSPKVEYFAVKILPASRITKILDAIFHDQPAEVSEFYHRLQQSNRVQNEFHVTLIHKSSSRAQPDIWNTLYEQLVQRYRERDEGNGEDLSNLSISAENESQPELGQCNVRLERVVWDQRLMAIVVGLEGGEDGVAADGSSAFRTTNRFAHITIGTANDSIKPKESNDLLQRWSDDGIGGSSGINEVTVKGQVVLGGSVRGVLSRY